MLFSPARARNQRPCRPNATDPEPNPLGTLQNGVGGPGVKIAIAKFGVGRFPQETLLVLIVSSLYLKSKF
jgi:hypothetical protein